MASVVDICNQALSHLGDSATVADIDPPEGSPQAEHCARFFPLALNAMLEMHDWGFARRRGTLAKLAISPASGWAHCYAMPAKVVRVLAILPEGEALDGNGKSADYAIEVDASGDSIILTNQTNAVIRYTALVTDSTKFSPLFSECLGWLLASKLAGPVLKGEVGMAAAQACTKTFVYWLGVAKISDAEQKQTTPTHVVGWLSVR